MDPDALDHLARSLAATRSRRRLLPVLAGLPLAGGLAGIFSPEDAEAAGRRQRRKKRHKHGKGRRRKQRKKPCKAESAAVTCAGQCGSVPNNCQKAVDCGPCTCVPLTACPAGKTCGGYPDGCGGQLACGSCANPTPVCAENVCTPCASSAQCASGELCAEGSCEACDVCPDGSCAYTSVQEAMDATPQLSTIYICPGTYAGDASGSAAFFIDRPLTLVGAGDGADGATSTILTSPVSNLAVVAVHSTSGVTLAALRVTGGRGATGTGVRAYISTVTVTNCTITENHVGGSAGGMTVLSGADVTLVDTLITRNSSQGQGGGIELGSGTITFDLLSRVTANEGPVGGVGGIRGGSGGTVTLPSVDNVTGNTPVNCRGSEFTGPGAICTTT